MNPTRRELLQSAAALVAAAAFPVNAAKPAEALVYKSPSCGCCADWIAHLQRNGFRVKVVEATNARAVRRDLGVPEQLASCHTALIGGYVVEGHVPAATIRRLITEKTTAIGVSVPGMPVGAPGMAGPHAEPFVVYLFDERGRARPFDTYRPPYTW